MALGARQVAPELLSKVTKSLGITALDQWYYVSRQAITRAIGSRVLNQFSGSIVGFLNSAYPEHHFDEAKLAPKAQERDQKFIEVLIRKLFPNIEIHTKARKRVGIINPETDAYLEIDFWMPSLKLGIEYQDKHHYGYQWYANQALEDYQRRDDIKKSRMSTLGYTLITIGFWWDKTLESLVATIRKARPDLLLDYSTISAEPIPTDPPHDNYSESAIPGVAGIMSPFIPGPNFDPTNWYAGEKHDGVRGVFNPELQKIFSRSGMELSVLPSLLHDIPSMLVEGEITAGRGNYNKTAALSSHSHHDKVYWPMFRYVLFDVPDAELGNYAQRYAVITNGLSNRPYLFTQSVFRVLLADKDHLKLLVDAAINDAGEGVIVQRDSPYEYGRAKGLAKIKVRRDADALVMHINKRSCTCKLVSGVTAELIFGDEFNSSNLKIGDIISYYHKGHSQTGKPKQAEIYKVRYDLVWEKLVSEKSHERKRRSVTDAIGTRSLLSEQNTARKKMGYWSKSPNVRAFFDTFARTEGFDPTVPENWYSVRTRIVRKAGANGLLYAYNYSFPKALISAYPELKFEVEKFRTRDTTKVRNKIDHWNVLANVRVFFDKFATTHEFDPHVPDNWYSVTTRTVQNAGGRGILRVYSSLMKALSRAYPELKFQAKKFRTHQYETRERNKIGHWRQSSNVRAFLDAFARTSGIDPLVPDNWYSVTTRALLNVGGAGLLRAYSSVMKALSIAYPALKFDAEKFRAYDKARNELRHWNKSWNVRSFFDEYAKTVGMDPLVPENWYSLRNITLRKAGGSGLLSAHNYNLMDALSRGYPELKFDPERFRSRNKTKDITDGKWDQIPVVRAFFDKFARTSGFDPLVPENWYSLRTRAVKRAGGGGFLNYYNLMEALTKTYPELKFKAEKFRTRSKTET